jgi:hypothetical protein
VLASSPKARSQTGSWVSLVLAADATSYIHGLTAFREGQVDKWLRLFTAAVGEAATKATELAQRLAVLQENWRERAGHPRRRIRASTGRDHTAVSRAPKLPSTLAAGVMLNANR